MTETAIFAAVLGAVIAGVLGTGSVLLGVFAERMFQRYGKVRCEIERIFIYLPSPPGDSEKSKEAMFTSLPVPKTAIDEAQKYIERPEDTRKGFRSNLTAFSLKVELYDEKDVSIGLRDVMVVFEGESIKIEKSLGKRDEPGGRYESVPVINLPPRQWVVHKLRGALSSEELPKLEHCDRVYFEGKYPDGRRKRWRVPMEEDEG